MLRTFIRFLPLVAYTLLAMPVQMLAVRFGWSLQRWIPVYWHRLACVALHLTVHVHGRVHLGRPLLLTANHVSWLDIVVLGSIAPLSFVAKSEVGRWPLFGLLADLQRTIYVDRQSRAKTGQTTGEMAARMQAGDIVVLFAEGTSSDGLHVLPFRSALIGAAKSAIASGASDLVHVQPVGLAYTKVNGLPVGRADRPKLYWIGDMDLLPHLAQVAQLGAVDAEVAFLDPLVLDQSSDRKQVAVTLHARVKAWVTRVVNGG